MEKYSGNWFLPQNPEIILPGILEIDREKPSIILRIYSAIKPNGKPFTRNPDDIKTPSDLVLGDGIQTFKRTITLFAQNGVFFENTIGIDLREHTYHAQFAFFGHHFHTEQDIKFKYLKFKLPYFGIWFDRYRLFESNHKCHESSKYEYVGDRMQTIVLTEGASLKLNRNLYSTCNNFTLYQEAQHYVCVEFENETLFWEHFKLIHKFEHFLHFAIGEPIHVIDCSSEEFSNQAEVLSTSWKYKVPSGSIRPMLFTAQNFKDDYIEKRIQDWYVMYDKFSACMSVFEHAVTPFWRSGSKSIMHTAFTNAILNIAQALEGFYKKNEGIEYVDANKFSEKKSEIITKIKNHQQNLGFSPKDVQFINNFLTQKRGKNNEQRLQDVIVELCKSQQEAISEYLHPDQFVDFANELKDLRNTLTHINHNDDKEVGKGDIIFGIFNTSQTLFFSLIMDKVGFSQEEIKKMLENLKGFM